MAPAVHNKYINYNVEVKWPHPERDTALFAATSKHGPCTISLKQGVDLGLGDGLYNEEEHIRWMNLSLVLLFPYCTVTRRLKAKQEDFLSRRLASWP